MIFYFSATGNSKYVAERIVATTDDKAVSIKECLKNDFFDFRAKNGENIGFVTPTYFWGLPTVVVDFLKRLKIIANETNYIFHVLTFGTTTGQAQNAMKKLLKNLGLPLEGKFIVRMVDTWTPTFNLTDKTKNENRLNSAESDINTTIDRINTKTKGDFNNCKIPFARLYYLTYRNGKSTRKFSVENTCINCELCAKQCPVSAIEMQKGKPVWTKERCAVCLGCLHRCPKFAIQYGKNTKKHGQYVNPKVKL